MLNAQGNNAVDDARDANDLYAIVGCPRNATCEQILAEYRLRALALHPDKNVVTSESNESSAEDTAEFVHKRFQKLQLAKEILTNAAKRAHYDLWLTMGGNCGNSSQFTLKEWMENLERIQQTLHWGQSREQPRLTAPIPVPQNEPNASASSCRNNVGTATFWERHSSPITKAFRDYRL